MRTAFLGAGLSADNEKMVWALLVEGETQEDAAATVGKSRAWLNECLKAVRTADKRVHPGEMREYSVWLPDSLVPELEKLEAKGAETERSAADKKN